MTEIGPREVGAAMRVTQEFGPNRARPRSQRLRERNPEIPREMHAALFEMCDRIEREAYTLGVRILDGEISSLEAAQVLSESNPELPTDIVECAVGQGTYFAAR